MPADLKTLQPGRSRLTPSAPLRPGAVWGCCLDKDWRDVSAMVCWDQFTWCGAPTVPQDG